MALLVAPAAPASAGGQEKVTICHVPPGNPENAHTITVGAPAARAHLRNHDGDYRGECKEETPPPPEPQLSTYRIVRRMPAVRVKKVRFLAGAAVNIWCHVTRASVVLRKSGSVRVVSVRLPDARNGNTIRVKEKGVLVAKARC